MNFKREQQGEVVVIHLEGDVMGGPEAGQLNDEINSMLDDGILKVVIDLGLVNRMNSSGLGILINALHTYKNNGGELKLANPTPLVQNLLEITKLNDVFENYSSVTSAVASF